MRTLTAATLTAICLSTGLLTTSCSGTDTPVATDPAPTAAPSSPLTPPTPTAVPTTGTYPAYGPDSYAFTLETSCFCAGLAPTRITVEDGVAISGVVVGKGTGRGGSPKVGTAVPNDQLLTIDDIIDRANDTEAASVQVEWPAGRDYPTSVYVDQDELTADEEVGWTISEVVLSP